MKKITFIIGVTIATAVIFSSCKKEEQSIEKAVLDVENNITGTNTLTTSYETMSFDGQVAPEDVTGGKITIKVTSNADPAGFEMQVSTTAGDYVEGKTRYLYERFTGLINAANHTDADAERIKVAPAGDVIKIVVGDNIIEKTINFDGAESLKYQFWNSSSSATIFLYGYTYSGSESKQIEVWTTRDSQHVTLTGIWDDPTQYQGLPAFNNFTFSFTYNDGWSYPADKLVGIYPEGDTLFVKYGAKTYRTVYNANTNNSLTEL